MKRLSLILAGLLVLTRLAHAQTPQWQDFDALGAGEAAIAQQVPPPIFGPNPADWPDWADMKAVRIPTTGGDSILVVRVPWHAPCGQYLMTVFGPVNAARTRDRLGVDFCAGSLGVVPVKGQDMPDLQFWEGRLPEPDGTWARQDRRVRWVTSQWMLVEGR